MGNQKWTTWLFSQGFHLSISFAVLFNHRLIIRVFYSWSSMSASQNDEINSLLDNVMLKWIIWPHGSALFFASNFLLDNWLRPSSKQSNHSKKRWHQKSVFSIDFPRSSIEKWNRIDLTSCFFCLSDQCPYFITYAFKVKSEDTIRIS